jgi:hypothetical protein
VLGGQPRLVEAPKKGRAHHGQEGEYATTNSLSFFFLPWPRGKSIVIALRLIFETHARKVSGIGGSG